MDIIVLVMFGSVLCTMTALNFMELRRIRKNLESKKSTSSAPAQN
jgi:glutaredoxin-related protein